MKGMAQQFGQSAKQNAMALRMYAWQMRVEITLKGDPQPAKLFAMRFDRDGVVQKTALNPARPAQPTSGLKEKKVADFKEWAGDLVELCKGYLIPSPALLQAFAKVLTAPAPGGFVQLYAEGVISPGDKLVYEVASANSATMSRVQSDAAARAQGAQRTNTYSRGGDGGSYRPSGGGGGRRR
jgi:hypothetical protein